jgi:hypothetical protein
MSFDGRETRFRGSRILDCHQSNPGAVPRSSTARRRDALSDTGWCFRSSSRWIPVVNESSCRIRNWASLASPYLLWLCLVAPFMAGPTEARLQCGMAENRIIRPLHGHDAPNSTCRRDIGSSILVSPVDGNQCPRLPTIIPRLALAL